MKESALHFAHEATRSWFAEAFGEPTRAQREGWPPIVQGKSTLLLAPTGSGKTLAAFLVAIDRLMFRPQAGGGIRVLYVSPLKALGVDVERNLRAPLAGIRVVADKGGAEHRVPRVQVRTGDTPQKERARLLRDPPDVLITTPESLYLMLTSRARETLERVETVIIDEIHSVVATKRGVHLMLSLERLEAYRKSDTPLQRIGLSATQRPLAEVARLLGGATVDGPDAPAVPRPVTIVDAGRTRSVDITVEVPMEDMGKLGQQATEPTSGPAAAAPPRTSIWPSMHPRLLELIRAHRTTMIFVNSRRLAERLAGALNELADEEVALAHHGSIARDIRMTIEDRLKRGQLRCIVATSSLELGIDMGAVDLVIQIETPPSVASGLQRIGRAGHHVGGTSRGVLFPKFRGDLVATAAAVARMKQGLVEETFYPRNALDILAQHVVAHVASADKVNVDDLFVLCRQAAPFHELPRRSFDHVLDMLSGRYPSERFAELRPRLTWDRIRGELTSRPGAGMLAVTSGGTIPDRGLYGVFLAGAEKPVRVGELDEEMVFESRTGDVFLLGASSWRIEEITHDRVLVSPAPGEPGKMPFWRGDRPGRPVELGGAIGALCRELTSVPRKEAEAQLISAHGLDERAARNLVDYLGEQREATGEVPSDRTVVVERFVDEVGDWRVAILSPWGARVHTPWAMAVAARLELELGTEVDLSWTDDGIVFRLPEADEPPAPELFFPDPDAVEALVTQKLGMTALFAGRFRENAARALLLPRRRPGKRTPLWVQRRRSHDLLQVASDFPEFPILLETYRECLRDVFDLPGLVEILRDMKRRRITAHVTDSRTPSPFASSLLFSYVAAFLYEGDAPVAERRAQAMALDHAQLRELLGEPELRELLDADAIADTEARLQKLGAKYAVKHPDGVHDLLLALGPLDEQEIAERSVPDADIAAWLAELARTSRVFSVKLGGTSRWVAAEDAARVRDALGVVPPGGLPGALLEPVADPLGDLVGRYARTHGPFRAEAVAQRFGLGTAPVLEVLARLVKAGRVAEGEMLPGGHGREFVDTEVLRAIKRRSLAALRREVEPVGPEALGRFLPEWQRVTRPARGLEGLLTVIEQLQGAAVPASDLESRILPARLTGYGPHQLDELCSAGEILWRGLEPLGPADGRIALYLTDHYGLLAPPRQQAEGDIAQTVRALLSARGALFFTDLVATTSLPAKQLHDALWSMVWSGEVGNDTFTPLRSLMSGGAPQKQRRRPKERFRSRRAAAPGAKAAMPGTQGRWSLLLDPESAASATERLAARARQLLDRTGVLTREATRAEARAGGFATLYPVLKAMEESGRVRRGYFIDGLGATQFALPGAEDRLRSHRDDSETGPGGEPLRPVMLAATDPANPYGQALPWPDIAEGRLARAAGCRVVLWDGRLVAYIGRAGDAITTLLPEDPAARADAARAVAWALAAETRAPAGRAVQVTRVDGQRPAESPLADSLVEAGFRHGYKGYIKHRERDE